VVGEAGYGAEAVAAARELKPDIVLTNIRMPATDGLEATPRVLHRPRTAGCSWAVPYGRGLGVFCREATWTAVTGNGWDPTDTSSGNGRRTRPCSATTTRRSPR
jgi:CheY-like chemotaxis protein